MFESPARHHYSVWDGCGNGIGTEKDCDWCVLRSRARDSVRGQGVIYWTHKIIDHGSIILLLMARDHTVSWEQTPPLHYGEVCPSVILASQPASNSPSKYVTPHIKHQDSANVKAFVSTSDTPPSRRSHHLSIIIQSIN